MKKFLFTSFSLLAALLMASCVSIGTSPPIDQPIDQKYKGDLAEARANFHTVLLEQRTDGTALIAPPEGVLEVIEYSSPAGMLSAYLTPDPQDGRKHPAIIWINGEFSSSPDSTAWDGPPSVFWEQGIVAMYPSFRGGGDNPGYREYLYGEADDLIAAASHLASLPYVDSDRIYLGGHSTGGTLALLAAESAEDLFRAVFAFGPVGKIELYNTNFPFDASDGNELAVRSPIRWLDSIRSKTFVIEGMTGGNIDALSSLRAANKSEEITFYAVRGYDHFTILQPGCRIIAEKILGDADEQCSISLSLHEFSQSTP